MELPTNFSKKIDVLQNYTKEVKRINPSSFDNIKPNGDTVLVYPVLTQDLRTFFLKFNAETGGDATHMVGFPQYMACLIDTLSLYINGTCVSHIPYYNFIYKLMKDFSISFEEAVKRVGDNPDPSILTTRTDAGVVTKYNRYTSTGVAGVNNFSGEYVIDDWIGFLATCEPSIFNVNLVGTMELHIKWADARVLWGDAGATFDYTISSLYGYIDCLDFKDNEYYSAQEKKIANEGSIEIPFKHYRLQTGTDTTNGKNSTTRFTESTNSLDKVMFTFFDKDRNTNTNLLLGTPTNVFTTFSSNLNQLTGDLNYQLQNGYTPAIDFNFECLSAKNDPHLLNTSRYFRRNGLGMKNATVQFELNSKLNPSFPLTLLGQYEETLKAFELNENNITNRMNPAIRDLTRYEKDFYCCALSTSHINDRRDLSLISGLKTQATSINISVQVVQDSGTHANQVGTPVVITETTRILKIGAGRMVSVVY